MPAVHHPNRCGNQLIPKKPHASRDEESEEIGLPTSHAILVLSVETLAGEQPPASQGASGTPFFVIVIGAVAGALTIATVATTFSRALGRLYGDTVGRRRSDYVR